MRPSREKCRIPRRRAPDSGAAAGAGAAGGSTCSAESVSRAGLSAARAVGAATSSAGARSGARAAAVPPRTGPDRRASSHHSPRTASANRQRKKSAARGKDSLAWSLAGLGPPTTAESWPGSGTSELERDGRVLARLDLELELAPVTAALELGHAAGAQAVAAARQRVEAEGAAGREREDVQTRLAR